MLSGGCLGVGVWFWLGTDYLCLVLFFGYVCHFFFPSPLLCFISELSAKIVGHLLLLDSTDLHLFLCPCYIKIYRQEMKNHVLKEKVDFTEKDEGSSSKCCRYKPTSPCLSS